MNARKFLNARIYRFVSISMVLIAIFTVIISAMCYSEKQISWIKAKYGSQYITAYNVNVNDIPKLIESSVVKEIDIVKIYTTYQENNKQIYIGALKNYNMSHIRIIEGRLPLENSEIAICQSALEYIGSNKKIGEDIILNDSNLQGSYIIVGILDDFLKSNVIYSFDNSYTSQKMPDAIVKYNDKIQDIATSVLINFNRNISIDKIYEFLDSHSLTNLQYNNFLYQDNKQIVLTHDTNTLAIISLIAIFISFGYTFFRFNIVNCNLLKKMKFETNTKSLLVKIAFSLLLLNQMVLIGGYAINIINHKNQVSVQGDFVIEKKAEFSTGSLNIPINLYDGLTEWQYSQIANNRDVSTTFATKMLRVNIVNNQKNLLNLFSKITPSNTNFKEYSLELEKYNYNIDDTFYESSICFVDQDILYLLEENISTKFDMNKLHKGQEFILVEKQEQKDLLVGDTLHFTQIVHPYNSYNSNRVDFESTVGYKLYMPNKLNDLFKSKINIVMSSNLLRKLGLVLPYTTVSIQTKTKNSETSIINLLKAFVKYKGNSTIDFSSQSEQAIHLNNTVTTLYIVVGTSVFYMLYDVIVILIYQAKRRLVEKPETITNFFTKNLVLEVFTLEIVSLIVSIPVFISIKGIIERLFIG